MTTLTKFLKIWNLAKLFFFALKKIQVLFVMPSIKVTKYDEPPKEVCSNGSQMSKWISAFLQWLVCDYSLVFPPLSTKHPSQTC
jgi:hypothetical protein